MRKNQFFSINVSSILIAVCGLCSLDACYGQNKSVQAQNPNLQKVIPPITFQDLPGKEIWYGNPDKPYQEVFTNFNDQDNHGTTPTLTVVDDPRHGKVWKVYKPSGAKRAEISRAKGYVQQEGETIYISYNWKIHMRQENFKAGGAVFQWKSEMGENLRQNYPFTLNYGNGMLTLNAYGPGPTADWWLKPGETINRQKNTLWKKSVPQNEWQAIIFGIKVSSYIGTDTTKLGYMEYWFNGVKQTFDVDGSGSAYNIILSPDRTRAYHRTLDSKISYPKWGVYGGASIPYEITAYVGDLRIKRK